ncbi:MAG TPA: alpha/beta hydrolase [Longimicrobium sp.]
MPPIARLLAASLVLAACAPAAPSTTPSPGTAREGYLPSADGARIFYRVEGSGADTIVVVHGGPGAGMEALRPDLAPLARTRTVIFYDQRGGGRSELPADTARLSADHHVHDLEAVRRFFGLERMTVVAHSFGPVLVARYAQRHPRRIGRMVFVGASGPRRAEAAALAMRAAPDTAAQRRMFTAMRSLMEGTAANPVATCREYEAASRAISAARGEPVRSRGTTCSAPPSAVAYYYRWTARMGPASFGDWDFTGGALAEVDAPLLVIHGNVDPQAAAQQHGWASSVREGRLLLIEGAGKGAHADRPDLVFAAIDTFLAGRWPEGAQVVR